MNDNYVSMSDMGRSDIDEANDTDYRFTVIGWRVAYILDGQAYITSAGSPESVTGTQSNSTSTITSLNNAALKYCNSDYTGGTCDATTAWAMRGIDFYYITKQWYGTGRRLYSYDTTTEATNGDTCYAQTNAIACGYGSDIIDNGSTYWFASAYSSAYALFWRPDARYVNINDIASAYGLRPVIKMSPSVYVTKGSGTMADPYILSAS